MNSLQNKFHELAYGMFIHYGIYSLHARGEWVWYKERMPAEEYFSVAADFKPRPGCAREWARIAVRAGMKYMVLTTRHHDGYFLGRRLLDEYCTACREHGLGIGFYYSVMDWADSNFRNGPDSPGWADFVAKTHRQIEDLATGYGDIDYLFYDGCPAPELWDATGLHARLRRLQPGMLISCRCGLDEDVYSSEQTSRSHPGKLWESCYTINDSWGCNRLDNNWKSPAEIIKLLAALRHNGGNLLLNVGPLPDGTIHPQEKKTLDTIGEWLNKNGESVYKVQPHPFDYADQEISTGRGNTIYITLTTDYIGQKKMICGIGNKINRITMLADGSDIEFRQEKDRLWLTGLKDRREDELPRVLKLELDGKPIGAPNPMRPQTTVRT